MYKNIWSPYKQQTLIAQPENWDDAQENDKYVVGIYKKKRWLIKIIHWWCAGWVFKPIVSLLQANAENCINTEVIGKRKREVGLVVPTKYNAFTKNKKIAMVLNKELAKHKKL